MISLPDYSEVHVVSDLHLGGKTVARQIFDQGEVFAKLIEILLQAPAETRQALVINGDAVDFLAEPEAVYFDAAGAASKLDRIMRDPSFSPVWDALRRFIKTPNRTLVLTLGNHDLELALPWVRSQLLSALAGDDTHARARIVLAFEEGGYHCQVGQADVLCVHGNEVDPWNVTDYEQMRRRGQQASRGAAASAWTPNGGTKLVIDVMNGVKQRYPFVDLLKPEEGAVIPTLLVLDPKLAPRIGNAFPAWLRSRWDQLRIATGFLEGEEGSMPQTDPGRESAKMMGRMLGEAFGDSVRIQGILDTNDLLQRTEQRLRDGVTPMELLGRAERSEFLGMFGAISNLVRRKGRAEVLREALEKLRADRSFHLKTADDTFRSIDKRISPAINFVVTGHTHLERALPRGKGGYYFNSGTWVRLMQLTDQWLATEAAFAPAYEALEKGTMAALDELKGLVLRRPTVVSFWTDAGGTHGELRHLSNGAFESQEGSRHTIFRHE